MEVSGKFLVYKWSIWDCQFFKVVKETTSSYVIEEVCKQLVSKEGPQLQNAKWVPNGERGLVDRRRVMKGSMMFERGILREWDGSPIETTEY